MHALAAGLGPLAVAALALAGCEKEGATPPAPGPGRFDSAPTKKKKPVSVDELCDVHAEAGAGKPLAWPELSGAAPVGQGWRWINLWATWCTPCVEEIPRLRAFRAARAATTPFDLAFVSVDDSDEIVARYRAAHADAPAGPRLAKADALQGFLASIGLDANAPIPVHIFVGPDDQVRCVRAGAITEADLGAVGELLGGR